MSDDQRRRRVSNYANGGQNALMRRPHLPGENLAQHGAWSREQLLRMDDAFVVAVEHAFRLGHESRASASNQQRAGAGDGDKLSLAS